MSIDHPPVIDDLPPAPQRGENRDIFTSKANAFVAAQQTLVEQVNAGLEWAGLTFDAADQAAKQAQQSASAASSLATASDNARQASVAAQQASVVAQQASETARNEAKFYAEQAAETFDVPALAGNAGKALVVDPDEQGFSWQDIAVDSLYPTEAVRPAGGEVAESSSPALLGGDYLPLYGVPQAQREFHIIAAGGSWSSPLYSGVEMPSPNRPVVTSHVPSVSLTPGASYQWRYRDTTVAGDTGPWSPAADFVAGDSPGGMQIGDPYAGGFFAGLVVSDHDGRTYGLIVSDGGGDSAQMGADTMNWRTSQTAVSSTYGTPPMTLADGSANLAAIRAMGRLWDFPAFKWVDDTCNVGVGLNGYNDWYLPARDELELLYRYFKPTTNNNNTNTRPNLGFGGDGAASGTNASSVPAGAGYAAGDPSQTAAGSFQSGGPDAFEANSYWSSTEVDASHAWYQTFSNGGQYRNVKTTSYRVRAVRRVAL